MNRKLPVLLLTMTIVFFGIFVKTSLAEERATREECLSKVADASSLIIKIGSEEAFNKIMDKNGPFIWKDAHVFCINCKTGILLAHRNSDFIGYQMRNYTDANGGHPYADILDALDKKGRGWLTYVSDQMGRTTSRLKHLHFSKVPGENIVLCAGYYP